ncbi:MAG: hypothetical protein IPO07_23125 [Haliscomenobacter sp.]|nr:hypothetical protein [Haliscomenobacter sp.]MBK9491361.1 hypothetical protein [Haliscomenobacter sp.]
MGAGRLQNSARKIDLETIKPFKVVATAELSTIQTSVIYQICSLFGIQLLAQLGKKESDWVSIENAYFELSDDTIAGAYETAVEKWLLTRNEDKDISRLHQWSEATLLGKHSPQATKNEELVLLIRAEFIRKYPNTLTHLVEKDSKGKLPF